MTFERACSLSEIPEDEAVAVTIDRYDVALARHGSEVFALQDLCSHAAVDCTVECWLHGSKFDLRTGKPTGFPATEPVATFPVEVRGDDVYVDVATTLNGVTPA
jgi:3-phenylpropionate/trans-cinnamate dioxygenase ferredoxin subunit